MEKDFNVKDVLGSIVLAIKTMNNKLNNVSEKIDKINGRLDEHRINRNVVGDALSLVSKHPMYKLTDKQIYFLVERGDGIDYIMAVSGYSRDEIIKRYERHKKSNVY